MTISAALATTLTFIVFILDMVLFATVRKRFRKQDVSAQFGNANWLTVGALGALLLAFGLAICTVCSRHSRSKY
jgi:Na+-translocating ferredoxin:NAD+ oxidoreductase RnfA subunit